VATGIWFGMLGAVIVQYRDPRPREIDERVFERAAQAA
jgi:hypothetical protein